MPKRREVREGTARDRKVRAGWREVLGVQVHTMEYEEIPEVTGKGEWNRRHEEGGDMWVTGVGGAVLQLQHRDDLGAGCGAERPVQMQSDRAVWLEGGWRGRYRVAAGGQRWWGWHMTWRADRGEGFPVRKEWRGELSGGGKDARRMRTHFTRAAWAPAPTTQGHRGQDVAYAFQEEMKLKVAEAIKLALDEGAEGMANRTYHVHLHTENTWHYAFPGEEGMKSILPLPECEIQRNEVSALAKVAEEWVREVRGAEQVMGATCTLGPSSAQSTAGENR